MSKIIIEAVAQEDQRYDTLGDWFFDAEGNAVVRVTGTDPFDQDDVWLIAMHELIEMKLCHKHGIVQGAVDAWDLAYTGEGEPGDDLNAPYQKEHRSAMLVEHMLALLLGLSSYGRIE